MKTATNPMAREILIPINILLNRSRPYLSVPNKNFLVEIYVEGISCAVVNPGKSESGISLCNPSYPPGVYSVISILLFFKAYREMGISVSTFSFPKKKTEKAS